MKTLHKPPFLRIDHHGGNIGRLRWRNTMLNWCPRSAREPGSPDVFWGNAWWDTWWPDCISNHYDSNGNPCTPPTDPHTLF